MPSEYVWKANTVVNWVLISEHLRQQDETVNSLKIIPTERDGKYVIKTSHGARN
jgi:hypothetical protein